MTDCTREIVAYKAAFDMQVGLLGKYCVNFVLMVMTENK